MNQEQARTALKIMGAAIERIERAYADEMLIARAAFRQLSEYVGDERPQPQSTLDIDLSGDGGLVHAIKAERRQQLEDSQREVSSTRLEPAAPAPPAPVQEPEARRARRRGFAVPGASKAAKAAKADQKKRRPRRRK